VNSSSMRYQPIDLVIVDLYPFEKTVEQTTDEQEIIEKIDIGGIFFDQGRCKKIFNDVLIVPSSEYYDDLIGIVKVKRAGYTDPEDRKYFCITGI